MNRLQLLSALLLALPAASASAATGLGGSRATLLEVYRIAKHNDFTFLRTAAQVREFVEKDRLVEVRENEHLAVSRVSFPFTRPIVKTFIERLAEQYHRATGDRLVVTSLTRPRSRQPRNSSRWSVHPTGMAMDLRVPRSSEARKWLEETLLELEAGNLLDVTRERRPPHYHVAVFPEAYEAYVLPRIAREVAEAATRAALAATRAIENVAVAAAQPAIAPGFPALAIAALIGGAVIALTAAGVGVRHARR
ncbi:MAG: DUF5715 family protein [Gemmatimonadaceae bacterium]